MFLSFSVWSYFALLCVASSPATWIGQVQPLQCRKTQQPPEVTVFSPRPQSYATNYFAFFHTLRTQLPNFFFFEILWPATGVELTCQRHFPLAYFLRTCITKLFSQCVSWKDDFKLIPYVPNVLDPSEKIYNQHMKRIFILLGILHSIQEI